MLTLGIETSCDETSASITDGKKVLSNIVSSSVHLHKRYGGVVPEIASRYHVEYINYVILEALKEAGRPLKDVRLVAVTKGPGLVGALLIGIQAAKAISYALGVPIIGVNHVLAHLYSAFLGQHNGIRFPFVGLAVSGGHTSIYLCRGLMNRRLLGQTQDDAAGEAFDKVAKILALGYPGGPIIERMAGFSRGKERIKFPRSYLDRDSLDFSFSGLKTAVLYYVRDNRHRLKKDLICEIAFAFQEAVLDVLVDKTILACAKYETGRVVVGGGVSANRVLREKFREAALLNGMVVYFPEMEFCLDNAAMVGVLGEALYRRGVRSDIYLTADPTLKA